MVPPGENLYLWIHYDQLLTRDNNQFGYQTHINPADQVEQFEITGKTRQTHCSLVTRSRKTLNQSSNLVTDVSATL